jgi:L-ribulokinase
LTIINRYEDYGVRIAEVINCGGIAERNPLIMQVYADVMGREMKIARSAQTCALGAAIAGAVVAGKEAGGYETFPDAQAAMCGIKKITFKPDLENHDVYQDLYRLYSQLHDAFGRKDWSGQLYNVMKDLLKIQEKQMRGK